jgi:hypothetical protein
MTTLSRLMLHLYRFWHVIDLHAAMQVGNWTMATDCRNRISACDAELDRLELK